MGGRLHGSRAIILTWEYPPRVVSDISSYCKGMADFFSSEGKDVVVISYDDWNPGRFWIEKDNLVVFTVGNVVSGTYNPLIWTLQMGTEIEKKANEVVSEMGDSLEIYAHDWLTIPSALVLKERFGKSLYLILHSIEPVRVGGRSDAYIESIKKIEKAGCDEAERIFVTNLWLKYQVMYHYGAPSEKIVVLAPGDFNELIEGNRGAAH